MTGFELQIPDRNFDCHNCGRCCRIWNVEVLPADIKRLESLEWSADDPGPDEYLTTHHGKTVLAHAPDGYCIFYDREKTGCVIHRRFGYDKKPVGCRLYPFQLATTFPNTVSTTVRFECPSVRLNDGKSFKARQGEFRGMAVELGMPGPGLDTLDRDGLYPEKCRQIVEALVARVVSQEDIPALDRLVLVQNAVSRIETLGVVFMNDMDMSEILPSFFDRLIEDNALSKPRRLGALEQARFLSLFTSFLRRDEEQLGMGMVGRFKRTAALFKLLNGKVNLRDLSEEHPDAAISRQEFFSVPIVNAEAAELSAIFDLFRMRLESYQFFGAPVYKRSFFFGLKTLFMLGSLILALAKWQALARMESIGPCEITAEDVDNAISSIHHAYGRSALLGLNFMNTLQRQICAPDAYERIINETLNGMPS